MQDLYIKNRKAYFDYTIIDEYTAGMSLLGSEVKSIREGKVSLVDTFCLIDNGEIFVRNMNIAQYELGTHYNHEPMRTRKLLMKKKEIYRIKKALMDKGITCVPLAVFISETGFIKLKIAVVKGKKSYDKRLTIKERDMSRELRQVI